MGFMSNGVDLLLEYLCIVSKNIVNFFLVMINSFVKR
jgi:hypothetical protein